MKESVCESERVADVSLNVQVRAWLRVCAAAILVRGGRRAGKVSAPPPHRVEKSQ